jgi:hypothetical protein
LEEVCLNRELLGRFRFGSHANILLDHRRENNGTAVTAYGDSPCCAAVYLATCRSDHEVK